jgi:hypothetical protein
MTRELAMFLASHCVENPELCRPQPESAWETVLQGVVIFLFLGSALSAICACLGLGGLTGVKRALIVSLALFLCATGATFVPGVWSTLTPLISAPLLAGGYIRYIKEKGNPELARRLGIALGAILGVSGLVVVGGAILFFLALNSWANSK